MRVLSALILIVVFCSAAYAKVDYSNVNLQVDSFEKEKVLDIGNPVIRIQKLNGQQPIKKNRFDITTESRADSKAKSAIPFASDQNQLLRINEPLQNFEGISIKGRKYKPREEEDEQKVRFDGSVETTEIQTVEKTSGAEDDPVVESSVNKEGKKVSDPNKYRKAKAFWNWFKGDPAYDALLLGMWSYHVNYDKDTINGTNDLLGAQYGGYVLGTFRNSYWSRSYMAGFARRVWGKDIYKGFGVDLQYKAGIFKGYGDRYPNVGGWTPIILPIIGFNYKASGVDMWIIPSDRPIFVWNVRLGLPMKYQFINRNKWGSETVYKKDSLMDNYTVSPVALRRSILDVKN